VPAASLEDGVRVAEQQIQQVRSRYAQAEHKTQNRVAEGNSKASTDTAAMKPSSATEALRHSRSHTQAILPAVAARRRGDLESIVLSHGKISIKSEFSIKSRVMTPVSPAAEQLQQTAATQLMQTRNIPSLQNGHGLPAGTRNG
jgi:hypothetical protein